MDPIRVLIADDHPLFRDGLHGLLDSVPDTEVVGEATTGEEAIIQAAALQPDVILMDIKMPEINGIEATRAILATPPRVLLGLPTDDTVTAVSGTQRPGDGSARADCPRSQQPGDG